MDSRTLFRLAAPLLLSLLLVTAETLHWADGMRGVRIESEEK